MLYTTEQIATMYSGKENNITPYMITHTWIKNGLKHIRGKRSGYLFKKEWIDEYIENQAIVKQEKTSKNRIQINKTRLKNNICKVH